MHGELIELGRALRELGYEFVTVTPETHRRVVERRSKGTTLRDLFGWNMRCDRALLPQPILELARAAKVLEEDQQTLRSRVRFSTLDRRIFAHSAYPTTGEQAVFFGPDTYRYCDLVTREMTRRPARCVVDVGCGSGAGGIVAAAHAEQVVLADINPRALDFARVNAALAGLDARTVESDILRAIEGAIDLVIANPPYMADGAHRTYRDGGGDFGEALAVRIARESLERLTPGGRLVLYTGSAIVDGVDTFLAGVRGVLEGSKWHYREIDPDVFGEEIERNAVYARVERIAAVALVATKRR